MLPFRVPGDTISQDVMSSLYIERFLDFSIWCKKEVEEDDGRDEEGEECICPLGHQIDVVT